VNDVLVIGGGAAGMMASGTAAKNGAKVLLLEKNRKLGSKLRITGKGRCNLTNNCPVAGVLENIPNGASFLHSVLNRFTPEDTIHFFESLDVLLKTERGNRVFPQSDSAVDVVNALRRFMDENRVQVRFDRASGIVVNNNRVTGVRTSSGTVDCDSVILATGGKSYPATGSTGDGYKMAEEAGHTVTGLRGSLVPLEAQPETCKRMQGLTLKNIRFSVFDGGKKPLFEDFGELLFTHFGISGPVVLSASAYMNDYAGKKYYAEIDLKPALDEQKLDQRILRDFEKYSNRDFSNALGDLLSRLMIPVIIDRSGISPGTKVHSITREQRLYLVRQIKGFRLDIDGPRPVEEAIITSGGIELREIEPKTMESKLVKGLFFAGEIIDADAYTGGFNLQIAWSTGFAAGNAAAVTGRV